MAFFDPELCPDPVALLIERLGPLAWHRIDGHPGEAAERQPTDEQPALIGVLAEMLARGVVLLSAVDAHAAYRDLFVSPDAAKKSLQRATEGNALASLAGRAVQVAYRPAGARQKTRRAWAVPERLPGLRAWLEALLEVPLVHFAVIEPGSPEALPDVEDVPPPAPPVELLVEPPLPEPAPAPLAPLNGHAGPPRPDPAMFLHTPAYRAPVGFLVPCCPHCQQSHFHLEVGCQPAPCRGLPGRSYTLVDGSEMPCWSPGTLPGGWPMTADVDMGAWD